MEEYPQGLLGGYKEKYKAVSLAQRTFGAGLKRALEGLAAADYSVDAPPPNAPWEKLERFERLKDFLMPLTTHGSERGENTSNYVRGFLRPLDSASQQLRAALAAQLASLPGSRPK